MVYLIGAGPGQEELITVKAVRVLKKCTAVLYDRLAGNHVLKYLNKNCKLYYCGKEPGCHYKSQEEINAMLIKLAKEGHIVGRIKGGDPYVFGRGGEEGEALYREGIDFEVVPGVTSAVSVLSYAGIPVTSRGYSQSFHVFTGMSAEKLNINWRAVSKLTGTLVFLMGIENIEVIVERLIAAGKDPNTLAAVVMKGTSSSQKKVIGTLENISKKVRKAGLKSPSIIVFGEVVKLSDTLNWYERKPLFGVNVCITRSKEQAVELRERILDLGAEVTEVNALGIKEIEGALEPYIDKVTSYNYIVFTSVNSVNIFFDQLLKKKIDVRLIKAKFAIIGPATEKALLSRGIVPSIKAEEFISENLSQRLSTVLKAGDRVLIPCSKQARPVFFKDLLKTGALVDLVHIYEPVLGDNYQTYNLENVDIIVYTSPSIVKNMIHLFGTVALRNKRAMAIGPITKKELIDNDISCIVCEDHSTEGILKKLLEIYKK
ncbi:MAG: uroporphyrinogen-III C-methyltransferase [Clostridiales bacterium]|uniref:uroporphyrinogen-III C-methyltransferase n=1 Tax=Clostridium sp. N3C TaxID=1776758 RepID=UPI00092E17EF|nr:uroporphyrinogen-III C-methyltransferase [Clostridium sp. N3C]NLZ49902.1 uroporphyrinogen-III C-methyltransferase [Clostridiales bacterium]SCN26132.1 Uroporphyrinogen-III C-methyltransferase [Clostridium sp. N3C]